ncbi:MAG: ATP-binding protein [Bacteroidetes bacterium]|nr:ATP-binding protein [Bacteroidota bacterium]
MGPGQLTHWNEGLRNGKTPEQMIDYGNLKGFALKFRNELRDDFGKDAMSLATWFDGIAGTRNKIAHYEEIDQDDFDVTFIHLKTIAKALKMDELEQELTRLKAGKVEATTPLTPSTHTLSQSPKPAEGVRPWFEVVMPQLDIRTGSPDESVFAANLAEVALGTGREVYNNSALFFSKTYFTAGLKNIARRVIQGLNGSADAENRVISLQTGFGGGKTHTLISLYHLCKLGRNAANTAYMEKLLESTGKPEFESAKIAVFTNTTNDAAVGRHTEDGVHIQTIWGEIAYQLGGRAAYSIVSQNDAMLIAPAGLMKTVLEQCQPALILIDELADYCVKASARKVGNSNLAEQTISFMRGAHGGGCGRRALHAGRDPARQSAGSGHDRRGANDFECTTKKGQPRRCRYATRGRRRDLPGDPEEVV